MTVDMRADSIEMFLEVSPEDFLAWDLHIVSYALESGKGIGGVVSVLLLASFTKGVETSESLGHELGYLVFGHKSKISVRMY
jgi:hypothetical protein